MNDWPSGEDGIPVGWTVENEDVDPTATPTPGKYLTFASEGNTTLALSNTGDNAPALFYSFDAIDWNTWDYSELTFSADKPLYICGDNPNGFSKSAAEFSYFVTSGSQFSVTGDVMSLLNYYGEIPCAFCFYQLFANNNGLTAGPSLPAKTLASHCYDSMFYKCSALATAPELPAGALAESCYAYMFSNCSKLKSAPDLPNTSLASGCYTGMFLRCLSLETAPSLPALTLADDCYSYMFWRCASLVSAPELPARYLANNCYECMFKGCSSLTSAPELPAITLRERCYAQMFANCTNLSSAPELPASSLDTGCYEQMFIDCPKINYINCLAKDIIYDGGLCTSDWLSGVSSSGTFVKSSDMEDWPIGVSGIPEGWTVEEL